MTFLQKHAAKGQIVTGLLYVDPDAEDLHAHLDTVETPLNTLEAERSVPRHGGAGKDQRQLALGPDRSTGASSVPMESERGSRFLI